MHHLRVIFVVGALALTAAACGSNSSTTAASTPRVIEMTMVDNAYQPTAVTVRKGERITLRFRNTGSSVHEATVGDQSMQDAHEMEMSTATTAMNHDGMAGMDGSVSAMHGMDDADGVTVNPGETKDLDQVFDQSGTVLIGCHEPGHWDKGMKATITVT